MTTIYKSIDIEDRIRELLAPFFTVFCPPLPAKFSTPCLLVQWIGGNSLQSANQKSKVDTFMVTIDARAKTEEEASDAIRTATALLEAEQRNSGLSGVEVNSLYSWGEDPVRPDLCMCSATLMVTAHRECVQLD